MMGNMNFTKYYVICCILWCVFLTGKSEEHKIELRIPPRPPRIYSQAPAGVRVTRVRALFNELRNNSNESTCYFHYRLKEEDDFQHFKINECQGTIDTKQRVEKDIGKSYHITVAGRKHDNSSVGSVKLRIEVTTYNKKAPTLSHSHYSQEILDVAPNGTTLMVLNGTKFKGGKREKELYYFMQYPSTSSNNPWLYPTETPLKINYTTGKVSVSASLFDLPESMLFYIGVADGGSPQRSQTSKLTLYIRNMSAPRNLKVISTSEESISLCWSPPVLGSPDGYRITYITRMVGGIPQPKSQGVANITVNDLYNGSKVYHGYGSKREKIKTFMGHTNFTNLTYCHTINDLQIFTLYVIKITAWSLRGGLSMTSAPLTVMTKKRDCSDDICNKGICQEKRSPPGYACICMDGYISQHCDKFDPCAAKGLPCKNGICKWTDESAFYCLCDDKFIGEQCQWADPCEQFKCENDGKCVSVSAGEYYCKCPPLFTGIRCEVHLKDVYKLYSDLDSYCSSVTTRHEFGTLEWPRTYVGNEAIVDCSKLQTDAKISLNRPQTLKLWQEQQTISSKKNDTQINISNPYQERWAKRSCQKDKSGKPIWQQPIVDACYFTNKIEEEFSTDLNLYRAENLSSTLLRSSVNNMSNIVNKGFDRKKGRSVIKVLSSFLKINRTTLRSNEDFRQSVKEIRNVISKFMENVELTVGNPFHMREDSILMSAKLLRKTELPEEILFAPEDNNDYSKMGQFFTIPKSAVNNVSGEEIRFKFVSYRDDRMFVNKITNKTLNMPVFSVTIGNNSISQIYPPVTYSILDNIATNISATCVFWNEENNSWSSEGLNTTVTKEGRVLCETNHLTAFSVLLDPISAHVGNHSKILSVITYIGLAMSTIALVITIATFILFRYLRRDRSGVIVVNLSIALLLLNICFILASTIPAGQTTCLLFAVLLHYCVASAFAWMLIEALNMHQLLVTVFPSVETHFLLKRLFFGWVCPFLFVGIALCWDYRAYMTENSELCVISSRNSPAVYYTTYLGPMVLVLILNCVVFGLVTNVLCQTRPESIMNKDPNKKNSRKRSPVSVAQIRGAITVVALLGVTWITGAFSVGSTRLFFQYLFCISTPLQGFVIFIVRVVQSADARSSWYYFVVYGIRGQQKFPPSSLRTHSSLQNTSSVNTQSTGTTPPTSVFVNALRAARRLSSVSSNYISKNKDSLKKKRRFSSPTLKDGKDSSDLQDKRNKLYSSIKGYRWNGEKHLSNNMNSGNYDAKIEIIRNDQQTDRNKTIISTLLENSISPETNIKEDNYRNSFTIPEFETKSLRDLFSSDLSKEILSIIPSIQTKSSENIKNTLEKEDDYDQKSPLTIDVTRLHPNINLEGDLFKVRSTSNLQNVKEKCQDFPTSKKSKSLFQMENLDEISTGQSTRKSNLLRFSSENTLDKLYSNDSSPLLGYDNQATRKVDAKSQNQIHSLNPD